MELGAGFILDPASVRTLKRAEARAPAAWSLTSRLARRSICRICLRMAPRIMGARSVEHGLRNEKPLACLLGRGKFLP